MRKAPRTFSCAGMGFGAKRRGGAKRRRNSPRIALESMAKIDTGDTAWLIVSSALVLLMTPALALFYGGMVRRKNVLSTILHSMAAIPILSVAWVLFGYSLAFGPTRHGLIGGLELAGMNTLAGQAHGTVPALAFAAFQMM